MRTTYYIHAVVTSIVEAECTDILSPAVITWIAYVTIYRYGISLSLDHCADLLSYGDGQLSFILRHKTRSAAMLAFLKLLFCVKFNLTFPDAFLFIVIHVKQVQIMTNSDEQLLYCGQRMKLISFEITW